MAAALFALPLIATAILGVTGTGGGPGGPSMQTVGFGTGGSECTLTEEARSFPVGTPIRAVATFAPALQSGAAVTIRMYRDGTELISRREILQIDEPTDCIYATLAPLESGHYRMEYAVDPSSMPPIGGEFDVTPT